MHECDCERCKTLRAFLSEDERSINDISIEAGRLGLKVAPVIRETSPAAIAVWALSLLVGLRKADPSAYKDDSLLPALHACEAELRNAGAILDGRMRHGQQSEFLN